jgi:hypothetical protein
MTITLTADDALLVALICSWAFALVLIAWPESKQKGGRR